MKYKVIRNLPDLVFELERLDLTMHDVDMKDMKGRVYLSKLEKREKYTFLALEQPDYDKVLKHFTVKEVYFILIPKLLLIYDPHQSRYVEQFFIETDNKITPATTPAKLMLYMLDFFSTQMYRAIPKFSREVATVQEKVLDESDDTDLIGNIHKIKRNLITFNSILEPILDLNKSLINHEELHVDEKSKDVLKEFSDRVGKIIKSIRNFEKQMDVLSSSNEAQIARKTNSNLGILTALNAILLLPPIVIDFWRVISGHEATVTDWITIVTGIALLIVLVIVYLRTAKILK